MNRMPAIILLVVLSHRAYAQSSLYENSKVIVETTTEVIRSGLDEAANAINDRLADTEVEGSVTERSIDAAFSSTNATHSELPNAAPTHLNNELRMDNWWIRDESFSIANGPIWRGVAIRDYSEEDEVSVELTIAGPGSKLTGLMPERGHVFENPLLGKVMVWLEGSESGKFIHSINASSLRFRRSYYFQMPGQRFILRSSYSDPIITPDKPLASRTHAALVRQARTKALTHAATDPAMNLLTELVGKRIKLADYAMMTTYPMVEASINGNPFFQLRRIETYKTEDGGWHLPAQPGMGVRLRVSIPGTIYTVTGRGITARRSPTALTGTRMQIGASRIFIDDRGQATNDLGVLRDGTEITIAAMPWLDMRRRFDGRVFLRWGRAQEEWLDHGRFPLAPVPDRGSLNHCLGNILQDISSAYDADRNVWLAYRGDKAVYTPQWGDVVALRRLPLEPWPSLSQLTVAVSPREMLRQFFAGSEYYTKGHADRDDGIRDGIQQVGGPEIVGRAASMMAWPKHSARLWERLEEPRRNFRRQPIGGWHNPRQVWALAMLYRDNPSFRTHKANPLERILDFWAATMPKEPDPVMMKGPNIIERDESLRSRAYAIAALQIGAYVYRKDSYIAARDLQFQRMIDSMKASGVWDAMINRQGWCSNRNRYLDEATWRSMNTAVAVFGQTCVFVENEEGAALADAWIRAAVTRRGADDFKPFRNYVAASISDRCGFIAVLRRSAGFLTPPPVILE